jgi:hypothetical protein
MTSLIWHTEPEQALIAMDTLGTSTDGKPVIFTTKFYVVPHLRMVICSTGAAFAGQWFIQVNDYMIVKGIDDLNSHAPKMLSSFWDLYKADYPLPADEAVTVYHIGFSEETDLIHSYTYRSTNGFISEPREYGLLYKPECAIPENYVFPQDIKGLMEQQRKIEKTKPATERICIGGEIYACQISREGIAIYPLGRFDDYDSDLDAILKNHTDE